MKFGRLSYYYPRHYCYVLAYLGRFVSALAAAIRVALAMVRIRAEARNMLFDRLSAFQGHGHKKVIGRHSGASSKTT